MEWTTKALREAYLSFYEAQGHQRVSSSSLIPDNDPTLLFTNAGMVQFKDYFLGKSTPQKKRMCSAQRCVRAGGKHNDLDNVGYTARHHTFFEMLGSFSFGDYFKETAITLAWQFLTEHLQLPAELLWVTVHQDDRESADIWLNKIKVSPERFSYCGDADNFWRMGEQGPCGPCTEIFYDHGPEVAGGPPGSAEQDGDRYVELYNLVFMQYDAGAEGELTSLPKPAVDTGMGLERLAAVMQKVHSNYDTDAFTPILDAVAALMPALPTAAQRSSMQVLADHIRSSAFLLADGVVISNEDRGYVLRRIIRRALRHSHQLGLPTPGFHGLVAAVAEALPELAPKQAFIEQALQAEEQLFNKTLAAGLQQFEYMVADLRPGDELTGEHLFRLYDTYGFPLDMTADLARERQLTLDHQGYEKAMQAQRERSKNARKNKLVSLPLADDLPGTVFLGYEKTQCKSRLLAIIRAEQSIDILMPDMDAILVLAQTPFYAESGGQVGDQGLISHGQATFVVQDTQRYGDWTLHHGVLNAGQLSVGAEVDAKIDSARQQIAANHTATHLLHAVLREELGENVQQKGSLVCADYLRFDFSNPDPLTAEQIATLERRINALILANLQVHTDLMSLKAARAAGAVALFDEKYDDHVRVLTIGAVSSELCGGTHVTRTGEIGLFKIKSESGVAAGIRRIEALTERQARRWYEARVAELNQIAERLKTSPEAVLVKFESHLQAHAMLKAAHDELSQAQLQSELDALLAKAETVGEVKLLVHAWPEATSAQLRQAVDKFKQACPKGVILLGSVQGDKVTLIAGVTQQQASFIKAADLLKQATPAVHGKGGGRPDLAQGGGTNPAGLDEGLTAAKQWLAKVLTEQYQNA